MPEMKLKIHDINSKRETEIEPSKLRPIGTPFLVENSDAYPQDLHDKIREKMPNAQYFTIGEPDRKPDPAYSYILTYPVQAYETS